MQDNGDTVGPPARQSSLDFAFPVGIELGGRAKRVVSVEPVRNVVKTVVLVGTALTEFDVKFSVVTIVPVLVPVQVTVPVPTLPENWKPKRRTFLAMPSGL